MNAYTVDTRGSSFPLEQICFSRISRAIDDYLRKIILIGKVTNRTLFNRVIYVTEIITNI